MSVDREIVFISVYRCPGCDSALEAADTGPRGWLRCPSCGRPSLPPKFTLTRRLKRAAGREDRHPLGDDVLYIPAYEEPGPKRHPAIPVLIFLGILAVPVLVCVALGREPEETFMLTMVTAVAMAILMGHGMGSKASSQAHRTQ